MWSFFGDTVYVPTVIRVKICAGAGYYYMRVFERLVRGTWIPTSNEILQPTL